MRYDLLAEMQTPQTPHWPTGIGGVPALLPDGTAVEIPVLQGLNAITFGMVGTGKTQSFTLPAAELLLSATPNMQAVFFEIKRTFIDRFRQPGDKVITHNPAAVPAENLFRPCLIREIRQAKDQEAEMRQIAEFLFADLLDGANQNRGWVEAARNAFIGVFRVIVDCFPQENTSNRQLVNGLRRMSAEELLAYLAKHPRNHSMMRKDFGCAPDNPAGYRPTRRTEDILFFFNQVLETFSGAFECDGEDTIQDYLQGRYGRHLFFLYDLTSSASSRPHMLYYLKKIKDYRMSSSAETAAPMLLVMDEIDKLSEGGKAADFGLFQAANLGRECGLQLLVTTQSFENLFALAPDFNEHITKGGLAGFPMVLAFRPGDPPTIQTLQTLYGSGYRRHLVMPASRYEAPTVKYELEPAVTDSDFASLDTGECYVKIMSCPPQRVRIIHSQPKEAFNGSELPAVY